MDSRIYRHFFCILICSSNQIDWRIDLEVVVCIFVVVSERDRPE
jgi:hypothetical protein